MKKLYTAPEILFEDFSLSDSVAAGCEEIVGNPSKGSCAIIGSGGITVFTSDMVSVCDFTPSELNQPDDKWNGFCYHVPTDFNNLFNS